MIISTKIARISLIQDSAGPTWRQAEAPMSQIKIQGEEPNCDPSAQGMCLNTIQVSIRPPRLTATNRFSKT